MDIIVNKIDKESFEKLNNLTKDKKENMFNSIEKKLRKAALPLADKGNKYIKIIIMHGICKDNKNIAVDRNERRHFITLNIIYSIHTNI